MTNLPDSLYIDEDKYRLSAGINNTNEHFTAVIKLHADLYYQFDDAHSLGCVPHNGRVLVEFALYSVEHNYSIDGRFKESEIIFLAS